MTVAQRPSILSLLFPTGMLVALALALPAPGPRAAAGQAAGTRAEKTPPADAQLALGKKVFVERCAKCHNEDGSAPVGDGLPLNKRALGDETLARNVNGRLKSASEGERRAVFAYIKSFRKS